MHVWCDVPQQFTSDYAALSDALCTNVNGGINAIWFSFALVAFFSLIMVVLALTVRVLL